MSEPDERPPDRAAHAHRTSRRRRSTRRAWSFTALGIITAAAVVVVVAAWPRPAPSGPGAQGVQIDRSVQAAGPVEIVGARALLIWRSDPDAPVTITVHNTSDRRVNTEVWWTLAKPSEARPWLHNALQAQPVAVALESGARRSVAVPVPGGRAPAGFYRLSLWAHTYDPAARAWVHSDGRGVLGAIQVIAPATNLLHVDDTSDELWISSVGVPASWSSGAEAAVRVSVVNARSAPRVAQIWWYLAPPGTKQPWREPRAVRSAKVVVGVDGGAVTDVEVPLPGLPNAGRYQLSVWLHESTASGSTPADGAFYGRPIVIRSGT